MATPYEKITTMSPQSLWTLFHMTKALLYNTGSVQTSELDAKGVHFSPNFRALICYITLAPY